MSDNGPSVSNFVQSTHGNVMFLAFGSTVPEALREMADGLDKANVLKIDALSLHYDAAAAAEDDLYCITARTYPEAGSEES